MKLKPWVKIAFLLLIIVSIILVGKNIFKKDIKTETNNLLKENNIPASKYSKSLEFALNENIYNEKYLDEYANITYSEKENFKEVISTFLDKGYKGQEINYIMELSNLNIDKLKEKDYIDISNYYTFKNFNVDNIERYNTYFKNNDYEYKDVVTYVNINMDLPVYTDTKEVSDPNDYLVLVNKYNGLPKNYKPEDIVYVDGQYGNQVPMRKIVKEALEELQKSVKEEAKIELNPTTAFREYSFQTTLYNNYVAKDGKEAADTYSARPGFSEHQTGLAIDLKNPERNNARLSDSDYEWVANNAHRFGFIIRFPKDKEHITGYQFENWHIRYVGKDIAKTIYENDLTLEEYIDLYKTTY